MQVIKAVENHPSSKDNLNCFLYYFSLNNNLFINNENPKNIAFLITTVDNKAIYKILEKDDNMYDSITKISSIEEFKATYTLYKSEYSTKHEILN